MMKAIDPEAYQTLTKTLILQQEHPYQPNQSVSNPDYTTTKDFYLTVRKTIRRKTVQQYEQDNQIIMRSFEMERGFDEGLECSIQEALPRFNTDDLLKQPQLFIIHPESKKQLQVTLESKTLRKNRGKQQQNKEAQQENGVTKGNKAPCVEDLIEKPSDIPMQKQNYFENIGGLDRFYNPSLPIMVPIPPKRHPFIFLSNASLLLSLFLAFRLDDPTFWMIFGAITIIYLLIGYHNEVRAKLFSMRSIKQLYSELAEIKKTKGYFLFSIECFHYIQQGNYDQKVVSYRRTEKLVPTQAEDDSFDASTLQSQGKYIDLQPANEFYMTDKESQARFTSIFNQFVTKYKRDAHQKYNFSFQTSPFTKLQGIYSQADTYSHIILILCGLFGLLFPFAIWFQSKNTRHQVKIIKKLTIK